MSIETFDFSEALKRLKRGKYVSCVRWGTEGDIYIFHSTFFHDIETLILYNTKREKFLLFTPNNENLFTDEWYEVKDKTKGDK